MPGGPQVRLGWPMRPADDKIRERAAIRPFEGFHRATAPKLFGEPKN
jgi:citronellol/citronellal dehydrogenase